MCLLCSILVRTYKTVQQNGHLLIAYAEVWLENYISGVKKERTK